MAKIGWLLFTVFGLAAVLGGTVYVAATNPDPSDAGPILRTFALSFGAFCGIAFVGGGLEVRHRQGRANTELYRRLALREVSSRDIRAAYRRTNSIAYTYLILGGLVTGLFFAGIGVAPDGPYQLFWAAAGVALIGWVGVAGFALNRSFRTAGDLLSPLGLTVTSIPAYLPRSGGGGGLAGTLALRGERYGRRVTIEQATSLAVTLVSGQLRNRSITSAATMATMTGEPARCWHKVTARTGADGAEVRRTGNGAGRWYLHDLLLAEHLAGG